MFIKSVRLIATVSLSLVLFSCATSGGGGATSSGVAMEEGQVAATALADKLGIGGNYVSQALGVAKSALGGGNKTADQKTAAAQQGVEKAAAQAQADGKALTDVQKTGLFEGLKELL